MRIDCPSCHASYDVPDRLLRSGRAVRCARCGAEWSPGEDDARLSGQPLSSEPSRGNPARTDRFDLDETIAAPPPPVSARQAARASSTLFVRPRDPEAGGPPPRRQPVRAGGGIWVGWAITLVVIFTLIWIGFDYRRDVMRVWPPSTRIYAPLGLAPGNDAGNGAANGATTGMAQ